MTCQRIPGRAQNHHESWRVQLGREMGMKASTERTQPGLQGRAVQAQPLCCCCQAPEAIGAHRQCHQPCRLALPLLCHCTGPEDETHQLQCRVPGGSVQLGKSGGFCLSHKWGREWENGTFQLCGEILSLYSNQTNTSEGLRC